MWPDQRITDLLGVETPIIQAPMAGAGGVDLVAAVAAAFMLGASAVQIGTAYLLTPEATIAPQHRAALAAAAGSTGFRLDSRKPAPSLVISGVTSASWLSFRAAAGGTRRVRLLRDLAVCLSARSGWALTPTLCCRNGCAR